MSTLAQNLANRANAQASTGPVTEAGKAASSKNAVTHALNSGDFVRPGEEDSYADLRAAMLHEFAPATVLEAVLVEEIRRAVWRLRRCGIVEAHLAMALDDGEHFVFDPMEKVGEHAEKIQKSVDRARSQAHRLLHKSTGELRKLQEQRRKQAETPATPINSPLARRTQSASQSAPRATARGAACPCNSGLKYKRCCGKTAPAQPGAPPKAILAA